MEYKVTTVSNTTWTSAILSILGSILGVFFVILAGMLNTYYGAFVLTELWKWFIAWPGLFPELPIRLALGFMLIFNLFILSTATTLLLSMPDKPKEPGKATGWLRAITLNITVAIVISMSWIMGAIWVWWFS